MSREEAQAFAKERHDAVKLATEIAQRNLGRAQDHQARQANKKRREPDFAINDYVLIIPKGFTTGRPSSKLDQQTYGPYLIVGMKGHSYQVQLPLYMKMWNVFHADRLRKYSEGLPGQIEPEQPPIEVNGQPEWSVREILDSRLYRGRLQYRAAWEGYDLDPTWYNAGGFLNAPFKVRDFHEAYPNKPGPPVRLPLWIQAYENDVNLEEVDEDSRPAKTTRTVRQRRRT